MVENLNDIFIEFQVWNYYLIPCTLNKMYFPRVTRLTFNFLHEYLSKRTPKIVTITMF